MHDYKVAAVTVPQKHHMQTLEPYMIDQDNQSFSKALDRSRLCLLLLPTGVRLMLGVQIVADTTSLRAPHFCKSAHSGPTFVHPCNTV
jgi:hypothetical protein